MQFFDSCVWFGGLVFVSMLLSVVDDLKTVLMPYLLLSFLIFLICLVCMVLSLILWVSLVLWDYQCFFVSMFCGYPFAVNVEAIC